MATATQITKPAAPAPKPAARAPKKATPVWLWEAKSKQGEVKKGEMEAMEAGSVEARLKSIGLQPTPEQ